MVITSALLKEMQINYRLVQRKFNEVADSDLDTLDSKLQAVCLKHYRRRAHQATMPRKRLNLINRSP